MKEGEQQCSTSAGDHLHMSNISPCYLAAHCSQPLPPLLLLLLHPPPSPFSPFSSSDLPPQPRTATPQLPSTKMSPHGPPTPVAPWPRAPQGPSPSSSALPGPSPPLRSREAPMGPSKLPPGERDRAETAAAGRAGCAA